MTCCPPDIAIPRLAWFTDFPPLAHMEGAKPAGTAYGWLLTVLAAAELEATFVPAPMVAARELLATGEVDGIGCMGVSPGRVSPFDFSAPYLDSAADLFVKAEHQGEIALDLLRSGVVATPGDGPLAPYLAASGAGIELLPVAGYREALDAVLSGEATAAALNGEVGGYLAAAWFPGSFRLPGAWFLDVPLGVALAKGRWTSFIQRFDAEIDRSAESCPREHRCLP